MCDIHSGLLADDRDIAIMLKKSGKPVIVAVNKVDKVGDLPFEFYEFYELGFEREPIAISSLHGTGSGDLLDAVVEQFPTEDDSLDDESVINVAVIGKPNAGKSSIINRMCGEERVIVSDIAGTTRDAVDTRIENSHGIYNFIDTAGIRRHSKVEDRIEKFSVIRANMAIERADVCLLMIDAQDGVTEQDEKIAGLAHEAGKSCIIVINKWDSIEKENSTVKEYNKRIRTALSYMPYAPIIYVSALTGQRVANLYEMINNVYAEARKRITTGVLNDLLNDATTRVQPPSDKGKRLKVYYMTQTSIAPPTFVIFCNSEELFHFSYRRYIENCLRDTFGFEGTPIKIVIRQRGDDSTKV
jgi:GTP-binding protein